MHAAAKQNSAKSESNSVADKARTSHRVSANSELNPVWQQIATNGVHKTPSHDIQKATPPAASVVQRMCANCEEEQSEDVQPKLTVGAPDDEHEREADAVSDTVMRMSPRSDREPEDDIPTQTKSLAMPALQLSCAGNTGCANSDIQGKPSKAGNRSALHHVRRLVSSPGAGSPLSKDVRSRVEPILGRDFSRVRVHSSSQTQQAASDINAKAFTNKNNIFLGANQSSSDIGLMAHELTHVAQQGGAAPTPGIQRRIVMRRLVPEMLDLGWFGQWRIGTVEDLRTLTDAEVQGYINDIGTVHHDYDDIINGTGEEFGFVGSRTYRRALIVQIIRNMHDVTTNLYFDDHREAVREVRKRALISLFMRASQGRTRGTRPTGYPRACGPDPGPRVSQAADPYWIVHPSTGAQSYWFELSATGEANGYEALRTLIFNHRGSACLRTLMHCDYMVSAQQFFVMADTMGRADFNQAVSDGDITLEIRWNSYENIVADTATSAGEFQSLQWVNLNREDDFVIGDHVLFFNHDAFDDMNRVHRNVRGNFSNWRLENAIIIDFDQASGEPRFQGHGYFSPKRRSAFVTAMAGKMNELVAAANSAINAGNSSNLGFSYPDGTRFEVVRDVSGTWKIFYHRGLGVDAGLPVDAMPLRSFGPSDYPNPFVQPGHSQIKVRRPIESRRESL